MYIKCLYKWVGGKDKSMRADMGCCPPDRGGQFALACIALRGVLDMELEKVSVLV